MEVTSSERRPMTFIALTLALACPFWVLGTVVGAPAGVPLDLPWTALVFVTPMAAAMLLVHGELGRSGVRELLKGAVDHRRISPTAWYVPTLLLMPAVVVLSSALMTLLDLEPEGTYSSFLALPALFVVFFVAAFCEEVGWTGYATDPLQARWGTMAAALAIGLGWVALHLVPWFAVHGLTWTVGYALFTVTTRILIVWLYDSAGRSVLVAVLFHTMINTSASLSPYTGSPAAPYVWTAFTALAAVVVTRLGRPRAQYRLSGEDRSAR